MLNNCFTQNKLAFDMESHMNLTQHIEDGYQVGNITGIAFVELSTPYDIVKHRRLIQKLYNTTQDSHCVGLSRTCCPTEDYMWN